MPSSDSTVKDAEQLSWPEAMLRIKPSHIWAALVALGCLVSGAFGLGMTFTHGVIAEKDARIERLHERYQDLEKRDHKRTTNEKEIKALDQEIAYRINRASKHIALGKQLGDPQVLKAKVREAFHELNGSQESRNKDWAGKGLHVLINELQDRVLDRERAELALAHKLAMQMHELESTLMSEHDIPAKRYRRDQKKFGNDVNGLWYRFTTQLCRWRINA